VKSWLIDTGPLVAYVDAADPAHRLAIDALDEFSGRLYTTAAVVTEAMHMVSGQAEGPEVLVEFLNAGGTEVAGLVEPSALRAAAELMKKYRDTPMDFADATLVLLAEHLGLTEIATLDRRGFSTYRMSRGRPFRLVLPSRR
jgi:predicted nucleic acid-binding protein